MKKIIAVTACLFFMYPALHAQLLKGLAAKVKAKVSQRADNKVDNAVDKGLDDVEGKNVKKVKEDEDGNVKIKTEDGEKVKIKGGSPSASLKSYSRFDFVPGEKIVYAEDFSQDVVGEFPLKWNTKGSGEIVTFEGLQGKWLQLQKSTDYVSPLKNKFPENATVEFDLLVDFKSDQRVPPIEILLTSPKGVHDAGEFAEKYSGAVIRLVPNGGTNTDPDAASLDTYNGKGEHYFSTENNTTYDVFNKFNKKSTPIHVAVWIQKQRMRVWLNETKLYDLPKALAPDADINQLRFRIGSYGGPSTNFQYAVSNIKVAVAAPDNRSKLITEGKFSTTGILFDVNSDKIKPTSFGVLKEIAGILNENPDVKVKIIGNTDSDGDAAKNLDLSKRRAAAVKAALAADFNIDAGRMQTDGMGASKPVADNKTAEGKAQNRRVEFVKM